MPGNDSCTNVPRNWVASNGSLASFWSPPYWQKEFMSTYLGKGLYWNGAQWVMGYWTMPAWGIKPCFENSQLLMNQDQALACNNATQFLNRVASTQQAWYQLYSYPNCNSLTAIRYIGNPLANYSRPDGLAQILYYEFLGNGSYFVAGTYSNGT